MLLALGDDQFGHLVPRSDGGYSIHFEVDSSLFDN